MVKESREEGNHDCWAHFPNAGPCVSTAKPKGSWVHMKSWKLSFGNYVCLHPFWLGRSSSSNPELITCSQRHSSSWEWGGGEEEGWMHFIFFFAMEDYSCQIPFPFEVLPWGQRGLFRLLWCRQEQETEKLKSYQGMWQKDLASIRS